MKKIFCILSILTVVSPAFAEGEEPAYDQYVATASYVRGAVEAMTSTYNATSNPKGKIQISGSGVNVSNISTENERIVVTKTNELKIPVGATGATGTSPTIGNMWVE